MLWTRCLRTLRSAWHSRQGDRPRPDRRFHPRLEALEERAVPAQIFLTVSTLADSGSGSLRAAILSATGSHSDKFTIGFGVTGTIDLQSPLPHLSGSIAIQGPGASQLTVERAASASFTSAIVSVDAGQTASLSGLTIARGSAGGIFNLGTLTVANSAVVNNSAGTVPGTGGGGILNASGGVLTLSGSIVSGNTAWGGGGILNVLDGTLTVSASSVSGNTAAEAGGILNNGTLLMTGSTVSGDAAIGFDFGVQHFFGNGGGMENGGTMTIRDTTFRSCSADFGGGMENGGTVTVSGCTFIGNTATGGGAIYNIGPLTIRDSYFCGNTAANGGAIENGYQLTVQGSTFTGNTASSSGGAICNLGTATVQQSTLSGNSAGSGGGGIYNSASGTLTIDDSLVCGNVAPVGADLDNLGVATVNDSTVCVISS
jgi:predicted outer membrane repeat protein